MHGNQDFQQRRERIQHIEADYTNNISKAKKLTNTILHISMIVIFIVSIPFLLCSLFLMITLLPLLALLQPREGEARALSILKNITRIPLWIVVAAPFIVLLIVELPFLACLVLLNLPFARNIRHEVTALIEQVAQQIHLVPQTTHDTGVNEDFKLSIGRLIEKYEAPSNNVNTKVETYINNASDFTQDERNLALKCLKYINQTSGQSSKVNLTLKQVLNLVWQACEDKNAATPGQTIPISNQDVKDRKNALVRHLIDAQTTYGKNKAACFTGIFNKIVETLDGIHPSVSISHYPKEVITAMAPKMIAESARELFKQKSQEDKKVILQYCQQSQSSDNVTKDIVVTRFIEDVKQKYGKELSSSTAYKSFKKGDIDATLDSAEDIITQAVATELQANIASIAAELFDKRSDYEKESILHCFETGKSESNKFMSTFINEFFGDVRQRYAEQLDHPLLKDFKNEKPDIKKVYSMLKDLLKHKIQKTNLEEVKIGEFGSQKKHS